MRYDNSVEYIDERGVGTHLSLYNPAGLQIFFAPFVSVSIGPPDVVLMI
jgi:hypothetical protein